MNPFTPKFITTEDGSATLALDPSGETMHSLKGAFAETVFIYGRAIETCFELGFAPRILSMGLGIGYVEILCFALSLKYDIPISGESFESLPELREYFEAWVGKKTPPPVFSQHYDDVLRRASLYTEQNAERIREELGRAFERNRWQLRPALEERVKFSEPFGVICFDAFSSKTSPDLWTETFLTQFLTRAASDRCVLATYARTGALNRSLRSAGFSVEDRAGFGTKRESTFAIRTR